MAANRQLKDTPMNSRFSIVDGGQSLGQWKTVNDLIRFADHYASLLRRELGASPHDRLDPVKAASAVGVLVASLDDLAALAPEDRSHLSAVDAKVWSGGGIALPGGSTLVVLHPGQTPERANATIMEEVAHTFLDHKPSRIIDRGGGMATRQFDERREKEAYWTAAAALLPSAVVAKSIWRRQPIPDLAINFGVSAELAEFRVKTLKLWRDRVASQ